VQSHARNRHAVRFPASPRIDWLPAAVKACDPRLAAAVNPRVPCRVLGRARARDADLPASRSPKAALIKRRRLSDAKEGYPAR